jgi:hypothetical protein
MVKYFKRPRDINQRAASTVAIATGQFIEVSDKQSSEPSLEEQHTAAVMLGRKGGQARAKKLTPKQKLKIARKAAKARWNK